MTRTTQLISILVLAAFVLAACGGSAPATESAPAPEAATQAPATEAPSTGSTNPTTAPENTPETASSATGEVSFSKDILPILQSRCLNCHGGQRTSEGLSFKTYEALMAGSDNGPVVAPGDSASSLFVTLPADGKMPKRGPKLTPAEVQLLTDWVNAGAPNN